MPTARRPAPILEERKRPKVVTKEDREKIKLLSPAEREIFLKELKGRQIRREQEDAMERGMNLTKKKQDKYAGITRRS